MSLVKVAQCHHVSIIYESRYVLVFTLLFSSSLTLLISWLLRDSSYTIKGLLSSVHFYSSGSDRKFEVAPMGRNFMDYIEDVPDDPPLSTRVSLPTINEKTEKMTRDEEVEAAASARVALEVERLGKTEKANRLYEHALALDPSNAEIMIAYGEFLEKHQNNVVHAEHMYTRALVVNPQHTRALINRKRTLPIVRDMDRAVLERIDAKRDKLFAIPDTHSGLRRAKRESYFQHVYHTNAIEGNTMTLGQTRAILETRMAVGGKSLLEHNEILGMDSALKYINQSLLSKPAYPGVSTSDILEIHRRVLGHVDPLGAGMIRNTQVFVGDHIPPAPSEVERYLERFILWLNSEDAVALHPVELAALAHYKLVVIHPFYDGNGRTSRLIMNLILMKAGYPPIIVRVGEKHEYYDKIQLGNAGDVRPFVRFVARCTERTIDDYLWSAGAGPGPGPARTSYKDGKAVIEQPSTRESENLRIITPSQYGDDRYG